MSKRPCPSADQMSSLAVQMVKIDWSFTATIGEDTPRAARALEVGRGIVTLARAYALPTIAEGIETETAEQAAQLTQAGCTFLQGYLFGRPEPLP